MMKTKLIVMLGLLFALPAVLKAEAQLQKISVELEDVSVVTLIKELKRQTGVNFLYNVDEVTRNGRISVSVQDWTCLLYTSPSPRDSTSSRMPSSA